MRRVISLVEFFSTGGIVVAAGLVALLFITLLIEIISRLLLTPIRNLDEISGYLLAGCVMLGLAYSLMTGRQVSVELFINRFKPKPRATIAWISAIVALLWAVPFLLGCWYHWLYFFHAEIRSILGTNTLLWIPALVLPVGGTLLFLQLLVVILKQSPFWRGKTPPASIEKH